MRHLDDGTLTMLVDGEIGSAELAPIRQHLDQCPECRARLDEAGAMIREADELVDLLEVPARTAPVVARRPPARTRWVPRQLAWAASLVAALGLGWAAGTQPWNPERALDSVAEPLAVESPRAEPAVQVPTREADARQEQLREADRPAASGGPAAKSEVLATAIRESAPADELERARTNAPVEERRANEAGPTGGRQLGGVAQESRADRAVAAPAAPAALAMRDEKSAKRIEFAPVTLPEAMRQLAGSLRLIEGLVPDALEAAGGTVRVVYPGGIILEQWRDADSVAVTLRGPAGLAPDSLARLAARIR